MGNLYNTQMDSCVPLIDSVQPLCQSHVFDPNVSAKTSINKADSGLTYNMNIPLSVARKRSRDSFANGFDSGVSSVLDNDAFSQIQQQQQQDVDRFISHHTEKVRLELEERRKRQSRMLVRAIQQGVTKKLKERDEEIQRMGKLNWLLQERVKSLYVENQMWRDLAQTNEATANSLRTNLEQVLAHVGGGAAALEDDAESSCGSSDQGWRKVAPPVVVGSKCRKCGEKESSVLLLPCRHLCVCTMCGSTMVGTCPVCLSGTNASVHVNMS
ncbi:hypothetical protein V6N11_049199 [Hibiscus sabdariffa]|uniref:RING-type domain-containing protein n=1 Tax=Hibiscus sabdariffa TaxID=183260 RepID=A0ABR2NK31_9ROSI